MSTKNRPKRLLSTKNRLLIGYLIGFGIVLASWYGMLKANFYFAISLLWLYNGYSLLKHVNKVHNEVKNERRKQRKSSR